MRSAWIRGLNITALAALFALLPATPAPAADCAAVKGVSPCIDADGLWPHAGGGAYFALGTTTTTPKGTLAFGIVGSFFTEPVGVRVASADPASSSVFLVDKALDATVLVALGLTDRLELTLAAPATLYQSGAGLTPVSATAPPLVQSAVRDVRFGLTFAFLTRSAAARGPALTGRLEFAAPTGTGDAFAGGSTMVAAPTLTFSYRIGRVDVSAEAVARLRGTATFANAVIGPQVGGILGSSVDILKDRWLSVGAEAFALYTTAKQLPDPRDPAGATPPALVPAEWIAHVSTAHFLKGDVVLSFGGGSAVPFGSHGAVTAPQYRLDLGLRYAPGHDGGDPHTPGPAGRQVTPPEPTPEPVPAAATSTALRLASGAPPSSLPPSAFRDL
jgi:OOP family OmpA-OmpF porin